MARFIKIHLKTSLDMERFNLSVVIPTLNSSRFISNSIKVMKDYLSRCKLVNKFEIIIIAQTSNDDTFAVLKKIKNNNIKPIFLKERGKGNAVTQGIKKSRYPYVLMIDDDLPYRLSFIDEALSEINKFDIVIASRYVKKLKHHAPTSRKIASYVYRNLVRFLFSISQKDIQAGLKLMKKSIFNKIPMPKEKRYIWDTELLYFANKKGLKIKEIPLILKQKPNFLKVNKVAFEIINDMIKLRLRTL